MLRMLQPSHWRRDRLRPSPFTAVVNGHYIKPLERSGGGHLFLIGDTGVLTSNPVQAHRMAKLLGPGKASIQ